MSLSVMLQQLASGMVVSVEIFVVTLLFSLPLGLLICFGRMSKNPVIRGIVSAYISVMRGTPLMLQLMVVYFGPYFIFGIRISMGYSLIAVFIAFSINYAAYFAEIYRGGIESISAGQYEAAKILGYSKAQTFFRIILPQVIKRILPSVTNEVITLVKDTSLAFVVAVSEMFTIAKQIASAQTTMMPFVIAAVFYFVFNLLVAIVMDKIEKKTELLSLTGGWGYKIFLTLTSFNLRGIFAMVLFEMKNIKKSFGSLEVLKDISLQVEEGEVLSIIGPSGSGKSTLLRCATGLETPDSGEIIKQGDVGLVFQNFNLFPHSVLKNITDAPIRVQKRKKEEVYAQARTLLKQMGLADRENAYPFQLSGGQQQRVSIARALCMNPKILFFDEPTSALIRSLRVKFLR